MPKMKTKRSISKRFEITRNGKIKRRRAFANHLLAHKPSSLKRSYRKTYIVNKADEKKIKRMLPYG